MFPIVGTVPETTPTHIANERSLARVGPVVVFQVFATVEGLPAEHTHELTAVCGFKDVRFGLEA